MCVLHKLQFRASLSFGEEKKNLKAAPPLCLVLVPNVYKSHLELIVPALGRAMPQQVKEDTTHAALVQKCLKYSSKATFY